MVFEQVKVPPVAVAPGAAFVTTIKVSVVDATPDALVALIVYCFCAVIAVGVPEMIPVVEFKVRPAGRAGLIEYEEATPLDKVGILFVMVALRI